jgi:hypothetical protein
MLIRVLVSIAVLAFLTVPLSAQDYTKAEVFGGFSIISPGDSHLYGWQASVAGHVTPRFSLVGDFGGAYRNITVGTTSIDARAYSFLGGPRVSFPSDTVSGFVHGLAGVTNVGGSAAGAGASVNGFQLALGGGVDVKAGNRLRIRVIQLDLLTSRLLGDWGVDARLGFGVVIPFGQRRR